MANCKCGGKLVTNDPKKMKYLKCKECEAIVFKESFGTTFSNKEMKMLLEGEEIYKELKSKKGSLYSVWVYVDFDDTKKIKTNFDKESPALFECQCGGQVQDKGKLYICEKCECKLMKEVSKVTITKEQAKEIFAGKTIFIENFISKENKPFDANLGFVKPGGWAEFSFDQEINEEDLNEGEDVLFAKKEADEMFDSLNENNEDDVPDFGDIKNEEDDEDYNDLSFLTGEK